MSTSTTSTRILVIGAGIAGPVLAVLLKVKGYDPVIFESYKGVADAGISLMLQANGLKVLDLIPGLLEKLPGYNVIENRAVSLTQNKVLFSTDGPAKFWTEYKYGLRGVSRRAFHELLIREAEEYGIKIHWAHKLVGTEQSDANVTAIFENGERFTGDFAIGCDGIHSGTRKSLFGEEQAKYTGLTQIGGHSPAPFVLGSATKDGIPFTNFYDDGAHMITYGIGEATVSWAITRREPEEKETWRHLDQEYVDSFRSGPFSEWPMGAGELVKTADKIIKYGLYDRQELKTWHKGRVVLIGDAAHPTSPHLGQGANQAFEDVYHLIRLLLLHKVPTSGFVSTALLESTFSELETLRIPRTSELVKWARKQGESRVVDGIENCKARDDAIAEAFADPEGGEKYVAKYKADIIDHPFVSQSEI